MSDNVVTLRKCPICRRPAAFRFRPFCSRRCAAVDLGRWFSGAYAVPGEPVPEPDEGTAERAGDGEGASPGGRSRRDG
jgi:endogenous inhibitor of DNA gyrase (YacG/DUF329 family)